MNDNDDWTLGLLTNPEVLEVNQHGKQPGQLERDENHAIWLSTAADWHRAAWVDVAKNKRYNEIEDQCFNGVLYDR